MQSVSQTATMARTSGQELLDKVKGLQNGTELSLLILLSPLLLRRSKNEKSSFQRNFFTLFFSKEKNWEPLKNQSCHSHSCDYHTRYVRYSFSISIQYRRSCFGVFYYNIWPLVAG